MRDVNRIPTIINLLQRVWMQESHRDLRFGQLLMMLDTLMCERSYGDDNFYIEDHEWQAMLQEMVNTPTERGERS